MRNNKSSIFLLIMGILMLLNGIWELITTGCSVYAGYAVAEYVGAAARAVIFSGLGVFAGAALSIGAGIAGIYESGRKGRGKLSIVFGIVVVLICMPATIMSWKNGYEINPISFSDGIIIPVIFLTASVLKK